MRQLYEVIIEVDAAGHAPPFYSQISTYSVAGAESPQAAVELVRGDLEAHGYDVLAAHPRNRIALVPDWDAYVAAHWSLLPQRLPGANEMHQRMDRDFVLSLALQPHE